MNTAVINVKVEPTIKKRAQRVVDELGLSLSGVINGYLRHLIKTKTVHFSLKEEPTEYLLQALEESKKDIKAGRVISFKNSQDALSYLDKMIAHDKKSSKH